MIRFTLICAAGHGFESWFPNGDSYDDQAKAGLVTCPACGSAKVGKGVMAPSIARGAAGPVEASPPVSEPPPEALPMEALPMIAEPERQMRAMLRAVREQMTKTADDVGARFPEEARRMHYGEAPSRAIYGEASPSEARALVEEGIDVAPLPPMPDDRN